VNAIDANRQAALMGLYYYGEAHYRSELTPPASLPRELTLMQPGAAVDWLEGDRQPGHEAMVRMALAELVSAPAAFGKDLVSHVQKLSAAIGVNGAPIIELVQRIVGDDPVARAGRFLKAFELAGGGGCGVRKFQLTASFRNDVSDVTASIEVNRPVEDFVAGVDPRNWSETLPMVWEDSYEISREGIGADRKKSPRAQSMKSLPPVSFSLFEKADWSFQLDEPFAYWRTILLVKLEQSLVAGVDPFVRYDYSLFECLENEFFGLKRPGGIDVDEGHGSCNAVAGDPAWSRLEARKAVRFTQPTLAINSMTFVFLIIWFSLLISTAACA
jgi:hypothetical protein